MKTCVFYGNGDCPAEVKPVLERLVEDLIEKQGVDFLYVGCKGEFNRMVVGVLRDLSKVYPEMEYTVVQTWQDFMKEVEEKEKAGIFPEAFSLENYDAWGRAVESDHILATGVEDVPSSSARNYCDRWMLNRADMVVARITQNKGSAARCVQSAKHRGLEIVELT